MNWRSFYAAIRQSLEPELILQHRLTLTIVDGMELITGTGGCRNLSKDQRFIEESLQRCGVGADDPIVGNSETRRSKRLPGLKRLLRGARRWKSMSYGRRWRSLVKNPSLRLGLSSLPSRAADKFRRRERVPKMC